MKLKWFLILVLLPACSRPKSGNPPSSPAETVASFVLPSGVQIHIVEAPFVASQFNIKGCGETDSECLINDAMPIGSAFGLPKFYVKSITASFGGRTYALDASDMYNAWGGRHLDAGGTRFFGGKCETSEKTDICHLRGIFSDGAGAFVAEWVVVNGKSTRTMLTDSNDVVGLFLDHIDPPEFN